MTTLSPLGPDRGGAASSGQTRAIDRALAIVPAPARWPLHALLSFVVYSAFALPTLWRMASPAAQSDIYQHTQIARSLMLGGEWISYSLYFPLSHLATLAEANEFTSRAGATLLLSGFVGLKAAGIVICAGALVRSWRLAWVTTAVVMVSMALPSGPLWQDIYLGQLNANVWHNSTTIAASVFVVPTFTAVLFFFRQRSRGTAVTASLLLAFATAFKPSFALAFLPALAVVGMFRLPMTRATGRAWLGLIVIALPTMVIMGVQYLVTFARPSEAFPPKRPVLAPLEVWHQYSPNIAASLVASLGCLALISIILLVKRTERLALVLAWLTVLASVCLYALVAERDVSGIPVFDGNWTWSAVPAMACAFFVASIGLSKLMREPHTRWWGIIGFGLLVPHVLIGIYYLTTVGTALQPTFIMN